MAEDKEVLLRKALDVLTEGKFDLLPQALHADAAALVQSARPWVSHESIVGFGIGDKITKGRSIGEISMKVYVKQKLPKSELTSHTIVPPTITLPGQAWEMPTDIEAVGVLKAELLTEKTRPLLPGYSIGHIEVNTGTFGGLVRALDDTKSVLALSNCHVLANYGLAQKGDGTIQPGPDDGGTAADAVGKLVDFTKFVFNDTGYDNLCDAAVAQILPAVQVDSAIPRIGVPKGVNRDVTRGMKIQKTGRTTGYTLGEVRDVDFRFSIDYPDAARNGSRARVGFKNQVMCSRYSDEGDSGALVCDMNGQVVGLHFVGGDSVSVFSPIQFVLDALRVELVTS